MIIIRPGRRRPAITEPAVPGPATEPGPDVARLEKIIGGQAEKIASYQQRIATMSRELRDVEAARQGLEQLVFDLRKRVLRAEATATATKRQLALRIKAENDARHAALLRAGQPIDLVHELVRERGNNLALSNQLASAENRPQVHQGPWS